MTGKYFNEMPFTSDELRKRGERGQLTNNDIYCIDDYIGFHHSWLGDEQFVYNKMHAYAHVNVHEEMSLEEIKQLLKEGKSIYPGQELKVNNNIKLLDSVEELRNSKDYNKYFI